MAQDGEIQEGSKPVVYITRPSNVYHNTGKAREVNINVNRMPSQRAAGSAVILSWKRPYVTKPPDMVKAKRDDFFQILGQPYQYVITLRTLFLGIFQTMADGTPFKDCFGMECYRLCMSLAMSGGNPYAIFHDNEAKTIERFKNTRTRFSIPVDGFVLNSLLRGSHLRKRELRAQWLAAMAIFPEFEVRQLWSKSENREESNFAASFAVHQSVELYPGWTNEDVIHNGRCSLIYQFDNDKGSGLVTDNGQT